MSRPSRHLYSNHDSLFDDENSVDRSSSSKPKEHVSGQPEHTNLAVNNRSVSR